MIETEVQTYPNQNENIPKEEYKINEASQNIFQPITTKQEKQKKK